MNGAYWSRPTPLPNSINPSLFYAKASYSPHGEPRALPDRGIPRFHIPATSGQGLLETMALKRDRISIEVMSPSTGPETGRNDPVRADAAIRSLARLIGRQIAREQFPGARSRWNARPRNRTKRNLSPRPDGLADNLTGKRHLREFHPVRAPCSGLKQFSIETILVPCYR